MTREEMREALIMIRSAAVMFDNGNIDSDELVSRIEDYTERAVGESIDEKGSNT